MSAILDKIEGILTDSFSVQNYLGLMGEILDGMQVVAPNALRRDFPTNFAAHINGYYHIGTYQTPENNRIIIMAVELKKQLYVENSRSTQRSLAKKLIESASADAALVAFFTEGDPRWRISFVRLDYEMKIEGGKLKTAENLTPARRYSFLVGKDEPCHTAIERFRLFLENRANNPTLDDLENAFSVEAVTKEFFELYCEKFHQLRECLEKNADFVEEAKLHNYTSAQFAKKLMGQIVFLYFLQKKGWLGVSAWPRELNAADYKSAFFRRGSKSRELIPVVYTQIDENTYRINASALNRLSDEDETFLSTCVKGEPWGTGPHNFMRRLFETSEKRNANFFDDFLEPLFYDALNVNRGEQGYDPALHCRIPFLSGGLFEPIDGYDWKHNNFDIPNELFSNKKDHKDRLADGILDIFDRYNFTMSEDEPLEREVAIDPEMLGKVFENLLDVNDRKSKGAFYTPREIVHYMCQESLINYLTNAMHVSEMAIRDFILYGDFMKDEDASVLRRAEKGDSFDLWVSEELYQLNPNGTIKTDRMAEFDKALQDVRIADPAVGSGAFPLGMLNEIVRARQNITTYMDITQKILDPKGAPREIRYRHLNDRSAHSLKYETIRNCIFAVDIEPSAVDIAQLRLWLALVIDDQIDPEAISALDGHRNPLPLPNLECNILCGNSLIDQFEGIKLINESDIVGTASNIMQVNMYQSAFDATLQRLIEKQEALFKCDETDKKYQLLQDIEALRDDVIISQLRGIATDSQLEKYQETKDMASKPFVLWQLDFARVFREKGGFDIVIGNPPYISAATQMINESLLKTRELIIQSNRYKTLYSKWDLYIPFMELGLSLLCDNGSFAMIVPYPLTNQIYAKKLRELIMKQYDMKILVDLKDTKVFTATVQNCIPIIVNQRPKGETIIAGFIEGQIKTRFTQKNEMLIQDPSTLVWNLTQENRASNKYSGMNVLGDFCYISKGMVLNADEKTAKGEFKKSDLISMTQDSIHSKAFIEGKDIDKYIIKRVRYLEWGTKRSPGALSRPTFEALYTSSKLLFNCLGEMKVSIDVEGCYYCEQAIRVAVPWCYLSGINNNSISGVIKKYSKYSREELEALSKQIDLLYLLGIMNSQTGADLLSDIRGGDYHIVPEHIRNIPIPIASIEEQQRIASIVQNIIEEANTVYGSEKMKDLQDELDNAIYAIYNQFK